MIYILDDTISQRRKDVAFLEEPQYKSICTLIEKPTMITIREEIPNSFLTQGNHMLCIHWSQKFFNDDLTEKNNSDRIKENFIKQTKEKKIRCVVFGGNTTRNKELGFIDKELFYRNLKLFLDSWIDGSDNLDLLYEGEKSNLIPRKKLLETIIEIINFDCPPYNNTKLLDLLSQYYPDLDPTTITETWLKKGFTKKEIRQNLNRSL